ncbi:MAG: hypothetical protein GTN36_00415 [Candidatus Aenigmarchaeota archaeon]|nr:hypothetical protein [Candidatus Aenigmarchaeota archaeon]
MTDIVDFFYDGRKLFSALLLSVFLLALFIEFQVEVIPYNLFITLFSKYFGEISPLVFLFFYYFFICYIFIIIVIGFYDLIVKRREKNE